MVLEWAPRGSLEGLLKANPDAKALTTSGRHRGGGHDGGGGGGAQPPSSSSASSSAAGVGSDGVGMSLAWGEPLLLLATDIARGMTCVPNTTHTKAPTVQRTRSNVLAQQRPAVY